MDLLFCLDRILTDFRHLFNTQNFVLFRALIIGLIANSGRGTVTNIYQASPSSKRYGSFIKFLSRGKWDIDAVAIQLIKQIQSHFEEWVYVYDDTKAIKTGKTQWGLHFFRNCRYQKRNVNQSKYHLAHQFGALGVLCTKAKQVLLFPVWVKLISAQTIRDKSDAVLGRICSKIPKGLIIFDRGFARSKVFARVMQYFGFDSYQVKSRKRINREGAVKFRCCVSNEVDILNRRIEGERAERRDRLRASRDSLVSSGSIDAGVAGGLSTVATDGGVIFCEFRT